MKKILNMFAVLMLVISILSGCIGDEVLDEESLKNMLISQYSECLQRYIYQDEVFEVDKFEIIRRQTNKEEKTDRVDCKLTVHNERYEGIFNYTLHLNYYDEGGWQIDSYESCGTDELKALVNTLPAEVINREVTLYNKYYGSLTFVEESFDENTGIITRTYSADNSYRYLNLSGSLTIQYELCKESYDGGFYEWQPTYLDNVNFKWNLESFYSLDDRGEDWFMSTYPQIYGCENEGEDYRSKIENICITNLNDDKITMELTIIVSYSNTGYRRVYIKEIECESRNKHFSRKILSNRDGDYLELNIDADEGIYIKYYNYERNRTLEYGFLPY